ncbi:UNVERIFIED_CONTAM: hypothetical protein FKN15_070363 [Acipenser sinensis]
MNTCCPPQPTAFFHTADSSCSHPRATASEDNAALGQLTSKPADAQPDYSGRWCTAQLTATTPAQTQEGEDEHMLSSAADCFFSHCGLIMQPPKSYSVGGQRSSRAAYKQACRRPARLQRSLVHGLATNITCSPATGAAITLTKCVAGRIKNTARFTAAGAASAHQETIYRTRSGSYRWIIGYRSNGTILRRRGRHLEENHQAQNRGLDD